jgi:hypothetical protein
LEFSLVLFLRAHLLALFVVVFADLFLAAAPPNFFTLLFFTDPCFTLTLFLPFLEEEEALFLAAAAFRVLPPPFSAVVALTFGLVG